MPEKYQSEIEAILRQADELLSEEHSKGVSSNKARSFMNISFRAFPLRPSRIMFTGIALLLFALVLSVAVPFTVAPMVWAGLVMFVIGYVLFFVRPGSSEHQKRWRGQVIEERFSMVDRVKRWLKG